MGIIFDDTLLEITKNTEEILNFSQKQLTTQVVRIGVKSKSFRMYLPKNLILSYGLTGEETLYITQSLIKKDKDPTGFKVNVQKAGLDSLYINFPKTLINAYEPKPTHCRLTYNPTHELWEYKLVKKETI